MSGTRFNAYPEITSVDADDYILVYDVSGNAVKRIKQRNAVGISDFGWTASGETWTYSAWDSDTGLATITVPVGADSKYTPGMAVRFEQTTDGTKYGRIRETSSTSLTVYMADGADLDNETITNPVYSSLFAPQGMPEADGAVTSEKLAEAFFRGRYQSNTTDSAPTGSTVQYGWGFVTGEGDTGASKVVTFPAAFGSSPVVFMSHLGFLSGSNPTSPGDGQGGVTGALTASSVTMSQFTTSYFQDSSISTSVRILYSWIAIGVV